MDTVSPGSLGGGEEDEALTLVLILFAVLLDAGLFCEAFLGFALSVVLLFVMCVMSGSVGSHGDGEGDVALTLVLMEVCKEQSESGGAFWGRLHAALGGLRFFLIGITSGSGTMSSMGRKGN